MGIKLLNKFLLDNCSKNAIHKIDLSSLHGKTIVVDTSIYLYKFVTENVLLENMYLFISLMKKYEIKPLFVFDGKPPEEKSDLLKRRKYQKKEAEMKYLELNKKIDSTQTSAAEKIKISNEMKLLKPQFTRINNSHIKKVKDLMKSYAVEYVESKNEADELCAYYTKTGKAWGCFTDDMDMFIYDCPFIIRNLSLMNHTAFLYDKQAILDDLEISDKLFREIMILSGTDYNIHSKTSLYESIQWLYEYKKYIANHQPNEKKPLEFYVWLVKNTKYIDDYLHLLKTYKLFILENNCIEHDNDNNICKNTDIDMNKLKEIMREEGFMFL
jgi:flap endonuclease-1